MREIATLLAHLGCLHHPLGVLPHAAEIPLHLLSSQQWGA